MDYTATWPEPQPPQPPQQPFYPQHHPYNPYSAPPPPLPVPPPPASYSYANPNPSPAVGPAAVDHYFQDPYAPHGGFSAGAATAAGAGLTGYYYERIAAQDATGPYRSDPTGYGAVPARPPNGLVPAAPSHVAPPLRGAKAYRLQSRMRKALKITKVIQSAYCGVCKIDCNSQEVLNFHKQGKKHKRNLQKLQEAITPKSQKVQVPANSAGHTEKKDAPDADEGKAECSKKKKRKVASEDDLETKKKKVLQGGAEPNQVKVCTICSVVVNSQKVYDSHITGSKHAAMIKQLQEAQAS